MRDCQKNIDGFFFALNTINLVLQPEVSVFINGNEFDYMDIVVCVISVKEYSMSHNIQWI